MTQSNYRKHGRGSSTGDDNIDDNVVTVGSAKKQKAVVVVCVAALLAMVYYFYFYSSDTEDSQENNVVTNHVAPSSIPLEKLPAEDHIDNRGISVIDTTLGDILPPPPPISIPMVNLRDEVQNDEVTSEDTNKNVKQESENQKSTLPTLPNVRDTKPSVPILQLSASTSGYPKDRRESQMLVMSVSDNKVKDVAQPQDGITKIGNLGHTIAQGKIIDSVLETAINSDIPGSIRAVVSRNVYAESGDNILIPIGSRLIGEYSFDFNKAKFRVIVTWNRMILPNGISVDVASPGVDSLGVPGLSGIVDAKIASSLFSTILLNVTTAGAAAISAKLTGIIDTSDVKSILNASNSRILAQEIFDKLGSKTEVTLKGIIDAIDTFKSTGSDTKLEELLGKDYSQIISMIKGKDAPSSMRFPYNIITKSIDATSSAIKELIERYTSKNPIIYVDQGTSLKVFVNRDIVFS